MHERASSLRRYAWLSLAAALATLGLKAAAWGLTGSVGLLSDALESMVNLAGALMALGMLTWAALPADDEHAYGHTKAEYFASGLEGALILLAAASIGWTALLRLWSPAPLDHLGAGMAVSVAAALVNLGCAGVLLGAGRRHGSVTLEANAQHLLTDVWTTGGVLIGVSAVGLTGWLWLDPAIALAVAGNIVWTGVGIVRRSVLGLMDTALPPEELERVRAAVERHMGAETQYHALRSRMSGVRRFVSLHVLVPGEWSVQRGHELCEAIEAGIRAALPGATVFTHLEPIDDAASFEDIGLDRRPGGHGGPAD